MIGVSSEIGDIPPNVAEGMIGVDVPPHPGEDPNNLETEALPIVSQEQEEKTPDSKLDSLINDLAVDLKPIVHDIEHGIKTTQNNYGRYMNILSQYGSNDRNKTHVIALALIKAGANRSGVASALKIMFP